MRETVLKKHNLDNIRLESKYFNDVLRCLFNTIIFHRVLSTIEPEDYYCDNLELYYVRAIDSKRLLPDEIDSKIEMVKNKINKKNIQIEVAFHEIKTGENFLFRKTSSISQFPWEKWTIPITIIEDHDNHGVERLRELSNDVKTQMIKIIENCISCDHVPQISELKDKITPFPIKIDIIAPSEGLTFGGLFNVFSTKDDTFINL